MPVKKFLVMLLFGAFVGAGLPIILAKLGVLPTKTVEVTRVLPPETTKKQEADEQAKSYGIAKGDGPPRVYTKELQDKPADVSPDKPLFMRGSVWKGSQVRVVLSDGRIITERDKVIASVDSTGVTLKDGTRIWGEALKFEPKAPAQAVGEAKQEKTPSVVEAKTPAEGGNFLANSPPPQSTVSESPTVSQGRSVTIPRKSMSGIVPRGTQQKQTSKTYTFPP